MNSIGARLASGPIRTPELRAFCTGLRQGSRVEDGILACLVYEKFTRQCGQPSSGCAEDWLEQHANHWGHCDAISTIPLAACIANQPELADGLISWTQSSNAWKRSGPQGRQVA
ncbi:MAG: DNA alkylation repair protein [Acidobacteria bacterium]|nr:DNA alkylation repair protein [Acidobacteriota bacterium]